MNNPEMQDILALVEKMRKALSAIDVTADSELFLHAATQRMQELAVLLALAQGKPWPFRKELSPLTRDINDYFKAIETRLNAPMPDTLEPEQIAQEIALRDECVERVDAARVVALAMLSHMSAAIEMTKPQSANLKAV